MSVEDQLSIEAFENAAIAPGSFSHEGHLYVAWLYLARYKLPEAVDRFSSALKRLTVKLGVPEKYHETITWFFMLAIAERREAAGPDNWPEFKRSNPDLFDWPNRPLSRYYSKDLLASDAARHQFRLPDKIAP